MKIRPYRTGDIEHIIRRPHDDYGPEAFEQTKILCERHVTYTFENDGIPVAIVGLQNLWKGVAAAWTIVSDGARGNGLQLTKLSKWLLDSHCKHNKIRRVQAIANKNIKENVKWLEVLGFTLESVQKKAAPDGTDLAMFVRFYE